MAGLALACLAAVAAVYAVAAHTSAGRRVDASALTRQRDSYAPWQAGTWIFEAVNAVTIAAAIVAIVLVARARGRTRLGVTISGGVLAAIVLSDVLKRGLRRLEAAAGGHADFYPSFPSGHATAALAAGLGLALVVDPRMRTRAVAVAVLVAAAVGVSAVVIHAHRPSDVAGGYLVAIGCLAAAMAVLAWRRPQELGAGAAAERPPPVARRLVAAGLALLALGAVAGLLARGTSDVVDAGLVGAAVAVAGAAALAAGALLLVAPGDAGPRAAGGEGHGALDGAGSPAR